MSDENAAYPDTLENREAELLRRRPSDEDSPFKDSRIGLGLSGGGVRSATFALGVLQALAERKVLEKIGFLSTVSGGGYIGAFYGRLFRRKNVDGIGDVQQILCPSTPREGATADGAIRWLRRNGRYLSPQGAGDLLLGGAVLMRNWLAVLIVIALPLLLAFLALQAMRAWFHSYVKWVDFPWVGDIEPLYAGWAATMLVWDLPGDARLWASPWFLLVPVLLVFLAAPLAWSYWLIRLKHEKGWWNHAPLACVILLILATTAGAVAAFVTSTIAAGIILAVIAAVALLALVLRGLSHAIARSSLEQTATAKVDLSDIHRHERHWLSTQLARALIAAAAVAAIALIDSLGQTVYAVAWDPDSTLRAWAAGLGAGLMGLAAFARRFVVARANSGGRRPTWWTSVAAAAAALVIVTLSLTALSTVSHLVAWKGAMPADAPAALVASEPPTFAESHTVVARSHEDTWLLSTDDEDRAGGREVGSDKKNQGTQRRSLLALVVVGGTVLVLTLVVGRSWPFLNRSTHLPLYTARLTRAYLGASNQDRLDQGRSVTRVLPGDDIEMSDYWVSAPGADDPYAKGAPLHLINVTINQTVGSRSQLQHQDRKGLNMALGPAGVSVGVRHHAVYGADPDKALEDCDFFPAQEKTYKVFAYRGKKLGGERLSLGRWVGISGAAFTTGLGSRTSLGLSFLAGFTNIRLGHWWDSGIRRARREGLWSWVAAMMRSLSPVHCYLLDEFSARFAGTARTHWYLSDGGHFENLGGYELIRRRLPLVIIVDAEADNDYAFEGLANLVRKARIDFGAEITFLEGEEIEKLVGEDARDAFGTLDDLRPRAGGDAQPGEDSGPHVSAPARSQKHAALAKITYAEGKNDNKHPGYLLYIKPTITGDEPADVLQYRAENPAFPHQSTGDQFFDEAQWESYRRLGQHSGRRVFKPRKDGETPGVLWSRLGL